MTPHKSIEAGVAFWIYLVGPIFFPFANLPSSIAPFWFFLIPIVVEGIALAMALDARRRIAESKGVITGIWLSNWTIRYSIVSMLFWGFVHFYTSNFFSFLSNSTYDSTYLDIARALYGAMGLYIIVGIMPFFSRMWDANIGRDDLNWLLHFLWMILHAIGLKRLWLTLGYLSGVFAIIAALTGVGISDQPTIYGNIGTSATRVEVGTAVDISPIFIGMKSLTVLHVSWKPNDPSATYGSSSVITIRACAGPHGYQASSNGFKFIVYFPAGFGSPATVTPTTPKRIFEFSQLRPNQCIRAHLTSEPATYNINYPRPPQKYLPYHGPGPEAVSLQYAYFWYPPSGYNAQTGHGF